jgi:hypothetical protein
VADVRCLLDGDDPVGRCRVDESLTFREGFEEGIAIFQCPYPRVGEFTQTRWTSGRFWLRELIAGASIPGAEDSSVME